jgi:hypothetical protein
MFLVMEARRAVLSHAVDGNSSSAELLFECIPSGESGVLEVGANYVFMSEKQLGGHRDRSPCELRLWVRDKGRLSNERIAKLGLSEEKIGELGFFPAIGPGPGDFFRTQPATLEAFVFVNGQLLEDIANALKVGRKTELIYVDIEHKGALAYGWEPDGSRIVWKIDNAREPSYVNVTGLKIRLSLFG